MYRSLSFFLVVITALTFSCGNNGSDEPASELYYLGRLNLETNDNGVAYWANGTQVIVPNTGNALAVGMEFINDQLHIVWNEWGNNPGFTTHIWNEDGTIQTVDVPGTFVAIKTASENNTLYIAGDYSTDPFEQGNPAYWFNGNKVDLPLPDGHMTQGITDITVSNGQVYTAGRIETSERLIIPAAWINDTYVKLEMATYEGGSANSVIVENGTVYIGGSVYDRQTGMSYHAYWVDGALTVMDNDEVLDALETNFPRGAFTGAMVVDNGEVILAGHVSVNINQNVSVFLSQDETFILENDAQKVGHRMFKAGIVDGRLILVGGMVDVNTNDQEYRLWVDGNRQQLSGTSPAMLVDFLTK